MPSKPLRPNALVQYRQPFLGSQAIAAGKITRAKLRSVAWRRLFRDLYVDARANADHLLQVVGASLILPPDAAIAGRSAAVLLGAAEISPIGPVEIISPRLFGPVNGLAIHTGTLLPAEVTTFRGVRVTNSPHTAWEIARGRPMFEAIAWIDSLARPRRLTTTDLANHAQLHRQVRGCLLAGATSHCAIHVPSRRQNQNSGSTCTSTASRLSRSSG